MIFKELPIDWNPTLNATGCLLMFGDKFLMLRRVQHKSHPGVWQLPGGKVDVGEGNLDGIVREVFEETGLDLKKDSFVFLSTVPVRHYGYDLQYHVFKFILDKQHKIIMSENEHDDYKWITLSEMYKLPLIADQDGAIETIKHLVV